MGAGSNPVGGAFKKEVKMYHKAYKNARKVNAKINKVLQERPLTVTTAREYLLFVRTVKSGLQLIEAEARRLLES